MFTICFTICLFIGPDLDGNIGRPERHVCLCFAPQNKLRRFELEMQTASQSPRQSCAPTKREVLTRRGAWDGILQGGLSVSAVLWLGNREGSSTAWEGGWKEGQRESNGAVRWDCLLTEGKGRREEPRGCTAR